MNKPVATLNAALSQPRGAAVSQSTTIEQSRAIAEVQSMVVVAQNCPRNEALAIQKMREACGRIALAEMAFFKFPRGGSTVQGPSVHLARELARCWGNINYGVSELDRDDIGAKSEMVAYAWDVQTNARAATAFIVPHKRDKKGGAEQLIDMRDIYENNANNAARRLREMVFSVLPKWYVEEAKALCRQTLEKGEGDKPLTQRVADAVAAFSKIGISLERVEAKIGGKSAAWTPVDLANLAVSIRSIRNKEVTAEDEFPSLGTVKLDEALKAAKPVEGEVVEPETPAERALLDEGDEKERAAAVARRDKIIETLNEMPDFENLRQFMGQIEADIQDLPPDLATTVVAAHKARQQALTPKARK